MLKEFYDKLNDGTLFEQKLLVLLDDVERVLGVEFDGMTTLHASQFLMKHRDDYEEAKLIINTSLYGGAV